MKNKIPHPIPTAPNISPLEMAAMNLGALVGAQQVVAAMGEEHEAHIARGVMAGVIVSLRELLHAEDFNRIMAEWEIDGPTLIELIELTTDNGSDEI